MILSAISDSSSPDHINQGLWASWRTGGRHRWLRPRMTELARVITGMSGATTFQRPDMLSYCIQYGFISVVVNSRASTIKACTQPLNYRAGTK